VFLALSVLSLIKSAEQNNSHRAAVIYNGSGQDKSDDDWVNHAIEHAKTFEQVVRPDSVGSS